MLRIANGELGYHEKASNEDLDVLDANEGSNNWTKYGDWYGYNGKYSYVNSEGETISVDAQWCVMFASWAAAQAGVSEDLIPKMASTSAMKNWYDGEGRLGSANDGYVPKAGDIVFYQDGGSHGHTGLVIGYDPVTNYVYTIEGNAGNDNVEYKKFQLRPRDDTKITFGQNGGGTNSTLSQSIINTATEKYANTN